MSDLRTAAQQALEAWDTYENGTMDHPLSGVMEVLRAALEAQGEQPDTDCHTQGICQRSGYSIGAQQEQEWPTGCPECGMDSGCDCDSGTWRMKEQEVAQGEPRREWQGLTDEEIIDGRDQLPTEDLCGWSFRQGAYFAETRLKEKNA